MKIVYSRTRNYSFLVLFFLTFLVLTPYKCVAQYHEVGFGVGAFNYVGDINPNLNLSLFRPGGQLFYRFNATKALVFRTNMAFGLLQGDETVLNTPLANKRQAKFSTPIFQVSEFLEYNFFNYRDKKTPITFCPYLLSGISLYNTNSKMTNAVEIEPEGGNFAQTKFSLPVGLGVKMVTSKQWNLSLESIFNKTFDDYLDKISNGYMDGFTTGDPEVKDWYVYVGLNFSYTFYKVNCPQ